LYDKFYFDMPNPANQLPLTTRCLLGIARIMIHPTKFDHCFDDPFLQGEQDV